MMKARKKASHLSLVDDSDSNKGRDTRYSNAFIFGVTVIETLVFSVCLAVMVLAAASLITWESWFTSEVIRDGVFLRLFFIGSAVIFVAAWKHNRNRQNYYIKHEWLNKKTET